MSDLHVTKCGVKMFGKLITGGILIWEAAFYFCLADYWQVANQ